MLSPKELAMMQRLKAKSEEQKKFEKERGKNDRLRGQLKRMTARAEKAEKLAATRLHGRRSA